MTGKTPARRPSRSPARRPQQSTGRVVARWAGRHLLAGCRWCAVWTGQHTKSLAVRTTHRVGGAAREWSSERAQFGLFTPVATCGGCGEKYPLNRQSTHTCFATSQPEQEHRFSGDRVRANEPVRATAVRLDRELATVPRQRDEAPRVARMTRREFADYARSLRTRRRDTLIERELWAAVDTPSITPPVKGPETSTAPAVATTPTKEITMTEARDWAKSAEVLADPGITSTDELIDFLQQYADGASTFVDNANTFTELMSTAQVDDRVLRDLQSAVEAAQTFHEHLQAAHRRAAEVYGDVQMPDFSKAS